MDPKLVLSGAVALVATPFLAAARPTPASPALAVLINEVDADQGVADTLEFIEVYDFGQGNRPLDGFVVVLYDGATDTSYAAYDLDGFITDAQGYFVIGMADVANVDLVIGDSDVLVDGSGAVALYVADASDFPFGTPVTLGPLLDAVVYNTSSYVDDPGLSALLPGGQPQLNEAGHANVGHSNGRCPDAAGGQMVTSGFSQNVPTPGGPSSCFSHPTFCDASDDALGTCACGQGNPDSGCDRPNPPGSGGGTTGGVRLNFIAQVTGALNRVTITGTGLPVNGVASGLMFRTTSIAPASVFGDGIVCTGSPVVRISVAHSFAGTQAHVFGHGTMAGPGTFYYQAWNRNTPVSFCDPAAAFTTTNGIVLSW